MIVKRVYLAALIVICVSSVSCGGRVSSSNKRLHSYPKVSEDAFTVYQLQSNKPRTHFYIDGKNVGVARRLKVYMDNKAHTVSAQAEGCMGKEEYIQPPYNSLAPLGFTYLMGECNGEELAIRSEYSPSSQVEPKKDEPREPVDIGRFQDGKYFALIIGNNDYKYIPKLKTAVNDAKAVSEILKADYGFETKLLLNATREQILDAMNAFKMKLDPKDNFLIYYAGHGEKKGSAYWLPINAKANSTTEWIQADTITTELKEITSKHILIISDSCYSGALSRGFGRPEKKGSRNYYLNKLYSKPSRTLISSGGNEPVSDGGGKGHSVFSKAFIDALRNISNEVFTGDELLYDYIKQTVGGNAQQIPQYSYLRNSGHNDGAFLFVKNK